LGVTPVSFDDAWKIVDGSRNKHLLLGNGFSIALKPDIFSYGSLFENADFSSAPHIKQLFDALGTQDFEIAIRRPSQGCCDCSEDISARFKRAFAKI
jgi:hypothetical protein